LNSQKKKPIHVAQRKAAGPAASARFAARISISAVSLPAPAPAEMQNRTRWVAMNMLSMEWKGSRAGQRAQLLLRLRAGCVHGMASDSSEFTLAPVSQSIYQRPCVLSRCRWPGIFRFIDAAARARLIKVAEASLQPQRERDRERLAW
jgi:hypothetical protein